MEKLIRSNWNTDNTDMFFTVIPGLEMSSFGINFSMISQISLKTVYKIVFCPDKEPCKHTLFQYYLEIMYIGLELTLSLWENKLKWVECEHYFIHF